MTRACGGCFRLLQSVSRLLLAAVLLAGGTGKLSDPLEGLNFVREVLLVPVNTGIIRLLGAMEVAPACWVLSRRCAAAASLVTYSAFLSFGAVHFLTLGLPHEVDCGCFGSNVPKELAQVAPGMWIAATWSLAAISLVLFPWRRLRGSVAAPPG